MPEEPNTLCSSQFLSRFTYPEAAMNSRLFFIVVFMLCCAHLTAQDIEAKLAGNTGNNGFTVNSLTKYDCLPLSDAYFA
jgi:hypothetical protein